MTGIYTGDGNDDRDIDIGVDLTTKNEVWVMVKVRTGGIHRMPWISDKTDVDKSHHFGAAAFVANRIQALVSVGFQVGTDDAVNKNGDPYHYIVIWQEG